MAAAPAGDQLRMRAHSVVAVGRGTLVHDASTTQARRKENHPSHSRSAFAETQRGSERDGNDGHTGTSYFMDVEVRTGQNRCAGTGAAAELVIEGRLLAAVADSPDDDGASTSYVEGSERIPLGDAPSRSVSSTHQHISRSVALGDGFERGSVKRYAIPLDELTSGRNKTDTGRRGVVAAAMGELLRIDKLRVTRDEVISGEQGSGWFLEDVRVRVRCASSASADTSGHCAVVADARIDSAIGGRTASSLHGRDGGTVDDDEGAAGQRSSTDWVYFPCRGWLGSSDCGEEHGPLTRTLVPETAVKTRPWHTEGAYNAATATWRWPQAAAAAALTPSLRFAYGTMSLPHPDKVSTGKKGHVGRKYGYCGEDAYFVEHVGRSSGAGAGPENVDAKDNDETSLVLGVADGVYEWRNVGIDAGAFSRGLMSSARDVVAQEGTDDPLALVSRAATHNHETGLKGSSTICVAVLDPVLRQLRSANLGDSGYLLLAQEFDQSGGRHSVGDNFGVPSHSWHVRYRTPLQEHEFGRPYQLGHHENADGPEDVECASVPLDDGDILVMGSDGLFDNLHDSEIKLAADSTIASLRSQDLSLVPNPTRVAISLSRRLCLLASQRAGDKSSMSTPYALAATEAFDMAFRGGKMDDITVLVVVVQDGGSS